MVVANEMTQDFGMERQRPSMCERPFSNITDDAALTVETMVLLPVSSTPGQYARGNDAEVRKR